MAGLPVGRTVLGATLLQRSFPAVPQQGGFADGSGGMAAAARRGSCVALGSSRRPPGRRRTGVVARLRLGACEGIPGGEIGW